MKYIANKTYTKYFIGVIHKGSEFTEKFLKPDAPEDFLKNELKNKKISIVKVEKEETTDEKEIKKMLKSLNARKTNIIKARKEAEKIENAEEKVKTIEEIAIKEVELQEEEKTIEELKKNIGGEK
ncbi:hypothetical protein KAR91_30315 [Candidatus Pacearchaeota archaeon]|nr:hypothetical protein [Candidatus Pacearchaeota archaeon]